MRKGEVAEWKKEEVKNLTKLITDNPVVAVVNLDGLPSKQLVKIKNSLRGTATIKMSRKRLIERALDNAKKPEMKEFLVGQPALLVSESNPFKLAKVLNDSKTPAAAKPGSVMPKDIVVPAGETSFMPGPIVSELGAAGVKAAIEKGKVVIKQDSVLAKAGDKVDKKTAGIMSKLGMEPLELGLGMVAALENGLVYKQEVLGITTENVLEDLQKAAAGCFNLTYNIGFPTKQNIELFVQKAFREAKALATEAKYLCKATVNEVLAKTDAEKNALKKLVKEEKPAEEKKEEQKMDEEQTTEETKEEAPAEEEKTEEAPAEETKEEATEEAPAEETTEE